jgi:hypothetical protein
MNEQGTAGGTFECLGCGQRFRWKEELAGRAVKCPCGKLVAVPMREPAEDVYDFAEGEQPKPVGTRIAVPMAQVAAPAVASGAGGALDYAKRSNSPVMDAYFPDRVKDLQAPVAFLLGGVVIEFVAGWFTARQAAAAGGVVAGARVMGFAMANVGTGMVFSTLIMLAAMGIASKCRNLSFGKFWTAVLKLSAISIGSTGVYTAANFFLGKIPFGFLLSWGVMFCMYFAMLGFFFDLDQEDTWYCVWVIFAVKVCVALAVFFFALGRLV